MGYADSWNRVATDSIDIAWTASDSAHQQEILVRLKVVERPLTHIPMK